MKKWLTRIYIGLFILVIIILIVVNAGMSTMRYTDEEATSYFDEKSFKGKVETIPINGRDVKIVTEDLQESDSILIVFVHGAPGTWDAFKDFVVDKDLIDRTRIVAYDRPGYGGSGTEAIKRIPKGLKPSTVIES